MISVAEIREAATKRADERKPLPVPAWGCVGDRAVRFRKLDADAYYSLRKRAKADAPPSDDDASPQSIALFVEMVATCVIDPEGNAFLDSEEGRALLRDAEVTPYPMLLKLADEAIEVNGLGELMGG